MDVEGADFTESTLKRRSFLKLAFGAVACAAGSSALMLPKAAAAFTMDGSVRRLALVNRNTLERFEGVYWSNGAYVQDTLRRLDVLLRDHKANQVCRFDPKLFDVLWQVQQRLDTTEPFEVVCGYRSRRTNALARRRSRGVAKESYHMRGMAIDVRLHERSVRAIAEEGKALAAGGVGVYQRSGFVHLDTGPVRTW